MPFGTILGCGILRGEAYSCLPPKNDLRRQKTYLYDFENDFGGGYFKMFASVNQFFKTVRCKHLIK